AIFLSLRISSRGRNVAHVHRRGVANYFRAARVCARYIRLHSRAMATFSNIHTAGPATAPILAAASVSGHMATGSYTYVITSITSWGETSPSPSATVATTTGSVAISMPATPSYVTARRIYRSTVGTSSPLYLSATVPNNGTTSYVDTKSDSALGMRNPPSSP